MGTQFVALLLGAVLVLGVREVRRLIHKPPAAATTGYDVEGNPVAIVAHSVPAPDWEELLIALRPVRERGWEGPVGQPAEESWPMVLFLIFVGLIVGVAYVAGPWKTALFAIFFLLGIAAALTGLGVADWQARTPLPPGGHATLIRGAIGCVLTAAVVLWIPHTTHEKLDVEGVRAALLKVSLSKRPRLLADEYHAAGIALTLTMVLAVLTVVALLMLVIVEVSSLRAMTAVGRGSRRRSTLWWAQFYRDRQPPLWGRYLTLTVIGFVLSGGVLLHVYTSTLGKS